MVSLAWRSGIPTKKVVKQLSDISCHSQTGFGENRVRSCADAVAKAIQLHMSSNGHGEAEAAENSSRFKGACPECGGIVEHEGGCCVCHGCGYSERA